MQERDGQGMDDIEALQDELERAEEELVKARADAQETRDEMRASLERVQTLLDTSEEERDQSDKEWGDLVELHEDLDITQKEELVDLRALLGLAEKNTVIRNQSITDLRAQLTDEADTKRVKVKLIEEFTAADDRPKFYQALSLTAAANIAVEHHRWHHETADGKKLSKVKELYRERDKLKRDLADTEGATRERDDAMRREGWMKAAVWLADDSQPERVRIAGGAVKMLAACPYPERPDKKEKPDA